MAIEKEVKGRFTLKHDTEVNWGKATGFIPKLSELIVYDPDSTHDYYRFKIGDGTTNVNALAFVEFYQLPAAASTLGGVKSGGNVTISGGLITVNDDSHNHTIANVDNLQSTLDAKVPTSRTINGKALTANITLSATDVGADASGAASTALTNANAYTDEEINEVKALITELDNTKIEVTHSNDVLIFY